MSLTKLCKHAHIDINVIDVHVPSTPPCACNSHNLFFFSKSLDASADDIHM